MNAHLADGYRFARTRHGRVHHILTWRYLDPSDYEALCGVSRSLSEAGSESLPVCEQCQAALGAEVLA